MRYRVLFRFAIIVGLLAVLYAHVAQRLVYDWIHMLLKSCILCKFHEINQEGKEQISRCLRENCYSQYSKCAAEKALEIFLEQESSVTFRPFSGFDHFYPLG